MASVNSSVETVNAAAAAIVTAEGRVQPVSAQKRRWGSCLSLYWCFGSLKASKRISHAALVPESTVAESTTTVADNPNPSTSIVVPFIAPPSSPLQSDPPTAIHSPGGLLALTVNGYSSAGQTHIFTIGPYAHETQLVTPPVFSAFTTEPSTAAVTPPAEPVQLTTPSSPEVPFAQLLTSSLNRVRRNSGTSQKLAMSCYELHHLMSPGSANSASGMSSPYADRRQVLEFRMVDASKIFESKKFHSWKWDSRRGSGSLTPDRVGLASYDNLPQEIHISEVASLANSETRSVIEEVLVNHRLSFEVNCEGSHTSVEKTAVVAADPQQEIVERKHDAISHEVENCNLCAKDASTKTPEEISGELKDCQRKWSSFSLGSVKEFNFDNREREIPTNSTLGSEWWTDEKVGKELGPENKWTFFPLLQPEVS